MEAFFLAVFTALCRWSAGVPMNAIPLLQLLSRSGCETL